MLISANFVESQRGDVLNVLKNTKSGILEPFPTATSLHKTFTSFSIFIVFQCRILRIGR